MCVIYDSIQHNYADMLSILVSTLHADIIKLHIDINNSHNDMLFSQSSNQEKLP